MCKLVDFSGFNCLQPQQAIIVATYHRVCLFVCVCVYLSIVQSKQYHLPILDQQCHTYTPKLNEEAF